MKHILNAAILLAAMIALVAGGCATTGSGVSDEDQIRSLLGQWQEAILAKDADKLMATYSENFAHDGYDYQAKSKAGLREFIDGSIAQGAFDSVRLSMEYMTMKIEEDKATVYPIEYSNWEGSVTMKLVLAEEEAGWLITDMAIEGM